MQRRLAITAVLLPLAAACASSSTFPGDPSRMRNAEDVPVSFVTEEGVAGVADACRNPLIDPRDQTRIRLVRSGTIGESSQGDYAVPDSRYGVRSGELLRVDCGTGQALGIVES